MPAPKLMVLRTDDASQSLSQGTAEAREIGRLFGTDIEAISSATYLLTNELHGRVLDFSGACELTIPSDLREDFSCGWSQSGDGIITFVAGDGVTLQSVGGILVSPARYSIGGIYAFAQDVLRISGV